MPTHQVKGHYRKTKRGQVWVKPHTSKHKQGAMSGVPSRKSVGKVEIVDIQLMKAEGSRRDPYLNVVHHSKDMKEANRTMSQMALWTPKSGATDKVDYDIKFADGSMYRGTIKLDKNYSYYRNDFSRHIERGLSASSGVRPKHMTSDQWKQYQNFVKQTPTSQKRARKQMDKFGFD